MDASLQLALSVFAATAAGIGLGWYLGSRPLSTLRETIRALLDDSKDLQDKLVADSLPAYREIREIRTKTPEAQGNGKGPPEWDFASGLPPDPLARGLELDEAQAYFERGER